LIGCGGSNTIANSYNIGNSYSGYFGGLMGLNGGSTVSTNSYTNKESYLASSYISSVNGAVLDTTQMRNQNNYISWDFTDAWKMVGNINSGFPILKECSSQL
jgi:hypothetical protein